MHTSLAVEDAAQSGQSSDRRQVILAEVVEIAQEHGASPQFVASSLDALMNNPTALADALESLGADRQLADYWYDKYQEMMQYSSGWMWNEMSVDMSWQGRRARIANCRYAADKHPVAVQATRLIEDYGLGQGLSFKLADDIDDDVALWVESFWYDDLVQEVLSSPRAQRERLHDLVIDGDVFVAVFVSETGISVMDIPAAEIEDVLTDRDNRRQVLAYKRTFRPLGASKDVTLYYRDVSNYLDDNWPEPPVKCESSVYVLHSRNKGSGRFGISALYPVLDWLRAQRDFMIDRRAIIKALATFAMQKEINTPLAPQTNPDLLITRNPTQYPVTGSLALMSPMTPAGATYTHGSDVKLEQFKTDTGAANAVSDNKLLLAIIGNGFGWFPHYFGDGMDVSRATTKSMELPVKKMIQGWQQLMTELYQRVLTLAIRVRTQSRDHVDVDIIYPPIEDEDVFPRMQSVEIGWGIVPRNEVSQRLFTSMVLSTLGENDVATSVDAIFTFEEENAAPEAGPQVVGNPELAADLNTAQANQFVVPPPPDNRTRIAAPVEEAAYALSRPGRWRQLHDKILAGAVGGRPGKWTARKQQMLLKQYAAEGGKRTVMRSSNATEAADDATFAAGSVPYIVYDKRQIASGTGSLASFTVGDFVHWTQGSTHKFGKITRLSNQHFATVLHHSVTQDEQGHVLSHEPTSVTTRLHLSHLDKVMHGTAQEYEAAALEAANAGIEPAPDGWPDSARALEDELQSRLDDYFRQVADSVSEPPTDEEMSRARASLLLLLSGELARAYQFMGEELYQAAQDAAGDEGDDTEAETFDASDFDLSAYAAARVALIDDSTWRMVAASDQPASDTLRDMMGGRADRIAAGEAIDLLAVALAAAYTQAGVTRVQWVTARDNRVDFGNPNGPCRRNSGKVRKYGDDFPSGDASPPCHMGCRCYLDVVK